MPQELEGVGAQQAAPLATLLSAYGRLVAEARKPGKSKPYTELVRLLAQTEAAHAAAFKGL